LEKLLFKIKIGLNMNILVTGGAGYIGSVLVQRLLSENFNVTVLDNFMFKQTSLFDVCKYDNFNIVNGDARDGQILKKLLSRADIIIPLAAFVGAPLCNKDPEGAKSINQDAIDLLVKYSSKSQRIIMPVTNSGYGIGQKNIFCTEETPLKPISIYGLTKVEAEKYVLSRDESITFRLATVFGMSPRMRLDLLVNDFVYRAYNDSTLVIFEGHFKRNYIHIQDVANAFLHAIKNFEEMKGGAYNVGLEDANLSKIELAKEIQKHIPNFVFLEAPIGEDPDKRDYIVSNQKIIKTGFKTKWSLSRGIRELIKGYNILKTSNFGNY
jgi:nucleoside-diphosphate-sugar epimerase